VNVQLTYARQLFETSELCRDIQMLPRSALHAVVALHLGCAGAGCLGVATSTHLSMHSHRPAQARAPGPLLELALQAPAMLPFVESPAEVLAAQVASYRHSWM